ncbi:MAG TPA: zinc-binding dehydrogenase [Acidimicrobiales bacterium]|nr:zinc-binding dehydrogenase [Acidimicrobiales bacterium]
MRAALIDAPGGPEVLRYGEVPDPVPGPGDVLIEVEAIAVEGGDTLARAEAEPAHFPHIVGYQCGGTVIAVGQDVSSVAVGDRVVGVELDGSHAELRVVPEAFCWAVPGSLSVPEAACVPIAFATAHDCLFEFGRLQRGEVALVHAGAGGVGVAAIQLAKRAGARVLATASSAERLERLVALGLDDGIDYTTADFAEEVRRLTDGHGADVVVDSVGTTLPGSLRCLAYRGRCVTVGDAGRHRGEPLDISTLRANNQTLAGYFLGAELFTGTRARQLVTDLLDEVAQGTLRVVIDQSFPLSEAAAAHAYIESRRAFGRVLLVP